MKKSQTKRNNNKFDADRNFFKKILKIRIWRNLNEDEVFFNLVMKYLLMCLKKFYQSLGNHFRSTFQYFYLNSFE